MGSARCTLLVAVAAFLAGCEDPLAPEPEIAHLPTLNGFPSSGDPQSWAVSATQIAISWADISNETGWEVHRSTTGREGVFSLLVKTAADVTTYIDGELKALTEYCYRIRSFRTNGKRTVLGDFLATTCATTFGPPNISVTPGLFGVVDVAWTSSSSTTDGFRVERASTGDGPWEVLRALPAWARSFQDNGRAVEQQVCYRIVAFNAYGETPSNVDCTTPPRGPAKLAATSPNEHSIGLTWEDRSAAEDGYEVQRAQDDFVWSVIATLPANASAYEDATVSVNTRYWYRVRATKDGGFSEFSETIGAAAASTAPDAPSYVAAAPFSSTGVGVSWVTDSKLAEGYRLERSTDDGASWTSVPIVVGQNWYNDDGLPSEQRVCYRLFAFNRIGDSPSITACTTPPAAPTNLVTVSIDDQTVEHQWSDNSAVEDGYELWLYVWEGWDYYYYYPVYLPSNTTSYRAGTSEYLYGVVAVKDGGYSDWAFPLWGETSAVQQRRAVGRPPASAQRTPPTVKRR